MIALEISPEYSYGVVSGCILGGVKRPYQNHFYEDYTVLVILAAGAYNFIALFALLFFLLLYFVGIL